MIIFSLMHHQRQQSLLINHRKLETDRTLVQLCICVNHSF